MFLELFVSNGDWEENDTNTRAASPGSGVSRYKKTEIDR